MAIVIDMTYRITPFQMTLSGTQGRFTIVFHAIWNAIFRAVYAAAN